MKILISILLFLSVILSWLYQKDQKVNFLYHLAKSRITELNLDVPSEARPSDYFFITGNIEAKETISDSLFLRPLKVLGVFRKIEMLQWNELRSEQDTTYTKVWSDEVINSTFFQKAQEYANPQLPLRSVEFYNGEVFIGPYKAKEVVRWSGIVANTLKLDAQKIRVSDKAIPTELRGMYRRIDDSYLYFERVSNQQNIGDLRISWQVFEEAQYSIIASLNKNLLIKIKAPDGSYFSLVKKDKHKMKETLNELKVAKSLRELLLL